MNNVMGREWIAMVPLLELLAETITCVQISM